MCVKHTMSFYDCVIKKLNEYEGNKYEYKSLKHFITSALDKVWEEKEIFYKQSGSYGDNYLNENLSQDITFWKTQDKWGAGSGFKQSVTGDTGNWCEEHLTEREVEHFINRAHGDFIISMKNIKAFFDSAKLAPGEEARQQDQTP